MTEFANLSEVLNRLSGGNSGTPETLHYMKDTGRRLDGTTTFSRNAGKLYSLWTCNGGVTPAGVAPTTAAVPTSATLGAIPFTNPTGGRERRLIFAMFANNAQPGDYGEFILYDRLFHIGNLSGTVTTAQNVQSGAGVPLTRHTGGVGNEIWMEIYGTAIGGTIQTATCSYTNQAGTAGRTTQATPVGGSGTGQGLQSICEVAKMELQAGDTGVRSVETLTLSASTGTAGVFGVTIANRITSFSMFDGLGVVDFTFGDTGTYVIEPDACLAVMMAGATAQMLSGILTTAER